ncbi:hypothetical protein NUM3379_38830 [Kineococcus sp. NUM-3379]
MSTATNPPRSPGDGRPPGAAGWPRSILGMLWRLLAGCVLVAAVVAGAGLALRAWGPHTPVLRSEGDVSRALVGMRTPLLDDVSNVFSRVADTGAVVITVVVGALVLRRLLHRWREGLFVAAATWGQWLVFLSMTVLVPRRRPGVPQLDPAPPTSSFPSGHTSAAIALYAALAVVVLRWARRRWVRVLVVTGLLAVPVLVGLSRLYRGMHHPTDLVGSVLCAGLVLLVASAVVLRRPLPEDARSDRPGEPHAVTGR